MKTILFHFYQAKKAGIIGFLLYIWLIISFLLVSACFLIFVVLLLDYLWEFFFYDTSFIRRKKPPSTQSYDIIKKLNLPELIRENVAEPRIKDVNNIPKDDTTRMSLSFKFAIATSVAIVSTGVIVIGACAVVSISTGMTGVILVHGPQIISWLTSGRYGIGS